MPLSSPVSYLSLSVPQQIGLSFEGVIRMYIIGTTLQRAEINISSDEYVPLMVDWYTKNVEDIRHLRLLKQDRLFADIRFSASDKFLKSLTIHCWEDKTDSPEFSLTRIQIRDGIPILSTSEYGDLCIIDVDDTLYRYQYNGIIYFIFSYSEPLYFLDYGDLRCILDREKRFIGISVEEKVLDKFYR